MGRRTEPWLWRGAPPLLAPLSLLVRLGWAVSHWWKGTRPARVGAPVLSVGNLSVGGTGKSFLVRALARRAAGAGLEPAVLLRGYGAAPGPRPLRVSARGGEPLCPPLRSGDEAAEHAADGAASVWVDSDRLRAARAALDAGARCLILDDGFQRRWQLGRDMDLLLADYGELLAGERLLPAGPFREPWSQVRFAHAVLVSGAPAGLRGRALEARLPQAWRVPPVFRLDRVPVGLAPWPAGKARPLAFLRGRTVLALSGLGRPESFEENLERLGAQVRSWRFGDHHAFTLRDLERPPGAADCVVTTAKDAARLPESWNPPLPVLVLRARADVSPAAPFWRLVDRALLPNPQLAHGRRKGRGRGSA